MIQINICELLSLFHVIPLNRDVEYRLFSLGHFGEKGKEPKRTIFPLNK